MAKSKEGILKEDIDKNVKKFGKHFLGMMAVFLLLCMGAFVFLWRVGAFGGFAHGEIKEITVKTASTEEICFQNLLLSASIINYGLRESVVHDGNITKEICIFNTGKAYCFEWPSSYPRYYDCFRNWRRHWKDFNEESVWEGMENMVYLGCLTQQETEQLSRYVNDYNPDGAYYRNDEVWADIIGDGGTISSVEIPYFVPSVDPYEWRRYIVVMYQHRQLGMDISGRTIIEHCHMNYNAENGYEKSFIYEKSYEENALAALELFENSEIYEKWLEQCNISL